MRTFYEEWNTVFETDAAQLSVEDNLADISAKKNGFQIRKLLLNRFFSAHSDSEQDQGC